MIQNRPLKDFIVLHVCNVSSALNTLKQHKHAKQRDSFNYIVGKTANLKVSEWISVYGKVSLENSILNFFGYKNLIALKGDFVIVEWDW